MKRTILPLLLIAGALTLHAAETSPLATAKFRWDMSAESAKDCKVHGDVKLGVPLDGGGTYAEFKGGFLELPDTLARDLQFLASRNWTVAARVKFDPENLTGELFSWTDQSGNKAFHLTSPVMGVKKNPMLLALLASGKDRAQVNCRMAELGVGGWHGIIITHNGDGMTMVIDGAIVNQNAVNDRSGYRGAYAKIAGPFAAWIGSNDGSAGFFGGIDSIAAWDRTLGPAEIAALSGVEKLAEKPGKPRGVKLGGAYFPESLSVEQIAALIDVEMADAIRRRMKDDPWYPRYHWTVPESAYNPQGIYWNGNYHVFISWQYDRNHFLGLEEILLVHLMTPDFIHYTLMPFDPDLSTIASNGSAIEKDGSVYYFAGWTPSSTFRDPQSKKEEGRRYLKILRSEDRDLREWREIDTTPNILGTPAGLRDRDAFVHRDGDGWVMLTGAVTQPSTFASVWSYRSKDLLNWTYDGIFYKGDAEYITGKKGHTGVECVNYYPLADKIVLTAPAPMSAGFKSDHFIGRIENGRFIRESEGPFLDWGPAGLRCAHTWPIEDGKGRVVVLRSMFEREFPDYRSMLAVAWDTPYCLPREPFLNAQGELRFRPVPEIENLRGEKWAGQAIAVADGKEIPLGNGPVPQHEIAVTLTPGTATHTGIVLTQGGKAARLTYVPGDKALLLDLREADILHRKTVAKLEGDVIKNHNYMPHQIADRLYRIPMEPDADGNVSLRIFTDRSVLEVYTGDGKAVTAFLKFPDPEKIEAKAFANGGAATVESAAIWKMNPIQWSFTTADAMKKHQ